MYVFLMDRRLYLKVGIYKILKRIKLCGILIVLDWEIEISWLFGRVIWKGDLRCLICEKRLILWYMWLLVFVLIIYVKLVVKV